MESRRLLEDLISVYKYRMEGNKEGKARFLLVASCDKTRNSGTNKKFYLNMRKTLFTLRVIEQ